MSNRALWDFVQKRNLLDNASRSEGGAGGFRLPKVWARRRALRRLSTTGAVLRKRLD